MRIASLPDERWAKKAAEWNPSLSTKHKTCRSVGRHRKRWEDEVNEFLKPEESEATEGSEIQKMIHGSKRRKFVKNVKKWKFHTQLQQHIQKNLLCMRSRPPTKDQTDLDWQGMQALSEELTLPEEQTAQTTQLNRLNKDHSERPTLPAEQSFFQGVLGLSKKQES